MQDGFCYKQNQLRYVFSLILSDNHVAQILNLYSLFFHSVRPVTNVTSDTSSLVYIPYCFVPIFIDQNSRRLRVGVMVGFASGFVSVAGRIMW